MDDPAPPPSLAELQVDYDALKDAKKHWKRDAKSVIAVAAAATNALLHNGFRRDGPLGDMKVGGAPEVIKELGHKIQVQAAELERAKETIAASQLQSGQQAEEMQLENARMKKVFGEMYEKMRAAKEENAMFRELLVFGPTDASKTVFLGSQQAVEEAVEAGRRAAAKEKQELLELLHGRERRIAELQEVLAEKDAIADFLSSELTSLKSPGPAHKVSDEVSRTIARQLEHLMREGQEMQAFAQRPPPADADADTDADANRSVDQDMLLGAMVGEARPGPGAPEARTSPGTAPATPEKSKPQRFAPGAPAAGDGDAAGREGARGTAAQESRMLALTAEMRCTPTRAELSGALSLLGGPPVPRLTLGGPISRPPPPPLSY
jgi:hypothetical protein